VTVERPLRATGIDAARAYAPKEIKALKDEGRISEDGEPIIRRIHKTGPKGVSVAPDPLRGLFAMTIGGRRVVVEYEPDGDLRDTETVPLKEPGGVEAFIRREVLPHAPDAWIDEAKTQIGYEISFTRYFYKPQPLRPLEAIRADILALEHETDGLMADIIGAAR
jgi:type I restriction enzyme M protein